MSGLTGETLGNTDEVSQVLAITMSIAISIWPHDNYRKPLLSMINMV